MSKTLKVNYTQFLGKLMIPGAVYVDGKVAIRFWQPSPKYVKRGQKEYVFDVRRGISLIFVNEDEVQAILATIGGCCDQKRQIFSLASQHAVDFWSGKIDR